MIFDKSPTPDDIDAFHSGLEEYNDSFLKDDSKNFAIVVKNEAGLVIAGIDGFTGWGRAYVKTLWVAENHRSNGIGTKLLAEVEKIALERGSMRIEVDTMSFQAIGFYEKNDYKLFGTLKNYPGGHYCNFYTKEI